MESGSIDRMFRQVFEALPYFIVVDEKARVVFISQDYASLLGTDPAAVLGRPVTQVVPDTRMHLVVQTGREEIGQVMTLYDHSQGREVRLVCNRLPIRRNGRVMGAMAVTTIKDLGMVDALQKQIHRMEEENRRCRAELEELKQRRDGPLDAIVGGSPAIVELKRAVVDYASSNLSILITGETGVGKEVFAGAVHQLSNRSMAPYIKVNCAAIPKDLLEAELFGYAEGAFSGAARGGKPGKFELANGGTLLLDEIGEMPLALQAKLLRVLQEGEVERVGGVKPVPLNVRVLCSTNQDIAAQAEAGAFRRDLYYRINTVELNIPPLRARPEDVRPLCEHFIRRVDREQGLEIAGLSPQALALLERHTWPGNVRELFHAVERAAVLCRSGVLEEAHFAFLGQRPGGAPRAAVEAGALQRQRGEAEKAAILSTLEQTRWNRAQAARLLGVDRGTLYHKMKKYGIQ